MLIEEKLVASLNLRNVDNISDFIFEKEILSKESLMPLSRILNEEKIVAGGYALGKILASYECGLRMHRLTAFHSGLVLTITSREDLHSYMLSLKPKLAFATSLAKRELGHFYSIFNLLLERVYEKEDQMLLIKFFEAVVAYHKYFGGR